MIKSSQLFCETDIFIGCKIILIADSTYSLKTGQGYIDIPKTGVQGHANSVFMMKPI